jgi:transcriptional regulator with PAS, ATPase and Fis domain
MPVLTEPSTAGPADALSAYFEGSVELVRAMADVLDIRTLFPRLSAIAGKMLPHDALALAFVDQHGQLVVEAATGDLPDMPPYSPDVPFPEDFIIDDLATEGLAVARGMNPTDRLVARGFRSVLGMSARVGEDVLGVGFWSKQPHTYEGRDVPLARRIVDHIALAVSHERLAGTARASGVARARTDDVDSRLRTLSGELGSRMHTRIVGRSTEWQDVLRKAAQVAETETTVLLTGESGTGKEVVARFIHRASPRKNGPLIALNCAALPEQLLEAEVFGYERGAFTSAQHAKPGQIELASGGVLFLDEVTEMSLPAQAKFLRVLQEREFQRLGGTRPLKANIRVIAATNRDLRKAVERGDFREDLFYRLQVFDIRISPLRERPSDILALAEVFLHEIGRSLGRPLAGLTRDARRTLLQYAWPGNVRELHNVLERAAILCEGGLITTEHLALQSDRKPFGSDSADLNVAERGTIAQVLRDCRGNKSKAAQRLGLSRTQLYSRMRKHGLEEAASA